MAFSSAVLCAGLPVVVWLAPGCSSDDGHGGPENDPRFAALTYDEHPESASQAVVTGGGEIVTDAAPPPPPPPPLDGGIGELDGGTVGEDGGTDGGNAGAPSGFWHFDDCNPNSNFLADATGQGANAQHIKNASCVPGISGQAIAFHSKKDIVQVPDEPQFTVDTRVAVAAWVQPNTVSGDHPIVLKRLNDQTTFSLGIHNGSAELSVVLASGKTVKSRAPIDPHVWTHVGGFYDGKFLFLFLNGQQVGQVAAKGTLRNVLAPIRIGATSQTQYFDGIIDEVWLSTNPVTATDIAALSCIRKPGSLAVTPATSGSVQPGTTFHYTATVTNNDIGQCPDESYFLQIPSSTAPATTPNDNITSIVNPQFSENIPSGQSTSFDIAVTGTEDADPGIHDIPFTVFSFFSPAIDGSVRYELAQGSGCRVNTNKELAIRDVSVVDDPVRTSFASPPGTPHRGVWTFGQLMRDMAPSPDVAPDFAEHLFQSWQSNQLVNGFVIPARPAIQQVLFANWPRTADGKLDLEQAPLRLLAIVNRFDLRDLSKQSAGEGRFVFGVLGPGNNPEQFTVILEYRLVAKSADDIVGWANQWHDLGARAFPSEDYNTTLEAITTRFAGRGAAPERPNGSGLDQLRTNEIALVPRWELRQFEIAPTGSLEPRPIALTPDLGFNGSPTLAQFVNQNEASIITETDTVPESFQGSPFLAGAVFNDLVTWQAPGIVNNEARFHLSLNTCNGCHGPETSTTFLQISPRSPGQAAALSPFMTGTTVFDPVTGAPRAMNDLARRNTDLKAIVCGSSPPPPPPVDAGAGAAPALARALGPAAPTLTKGINRVH